MICYLLRSDCADGGNAVSVPCAVNDLYGRTFGMWTTLSCVLCLCCARNPCNKILYGALSGSGSTSLNELDHVASHDF